MTQPLELTVSRTIPASQKDAFEAWLDPAVLARFMRPAPGMEVPKVEVDAREGGAFRIVMKAGDSTIPHHGNYRTIDRHTRLVFTWLSDYTTAESTVTIDFERLSDDETRIVLHHVGFQTAEHRDNHEGGWGRILETQADTLKHAA